MWRVIVRISFHRDRGSRLRNHVATFFTAMGLHNTLTGTWESAQAVNRAQAVAQMNLVLQALANPQAAPGAHPQAVLNHLWAYIDRATEDNMPRSTYYVVSETTEDRDEADTLEEALQIARDLAKEGQAGDPVSIEHNGRVIRQFVLAPSGEVEEEPVL
jgi:hypothetical protein